MSLDKDSRNLIAALIIGFTLFVLVATFTLWPDDTESRALNAGGVATGYGLIIEQTTVPSYYVKPGTRLTYTVSISPTDASAADIHLTITDTLPLHVTTDAYLAGTAVLPGGKLVWTPVLLPGETWRQQIAVTVAVEYEGELVNVVEATSLEGFSAVSFHSNYATPADQRSYFPIVMRRYPRTGMLLVNPGFEGIGVPVDNSVFVPGNWTRDTFTGVEYGEIFTPEGWVTWWEEGEYGRPECKVIPNEPPFTSPPRIYQGYHAGMCFTFYRKQHAGYYQHVGNLRPGAVVEGWYYAHAWACDKNDDMLSCGDPEAFSFRVGIDPTGGTDPFSNTIIWSKEQYIYDKYERVGPVRATVGPTGAVTFFLHSHGKWPYKHNVAFWDNPSLYYVEP
ncbi:MAG TPA: hypothetical protein PLJ78_16150 [Anaerolineae bacterium]|nr:hypothetical protein [Anaerolineae bacterium]HQK15465.1 hypothetical protein [Anaerolineae bacterium]